MWISYLNKVLLDVIVLFLDNMYYNSTIDDIDYVKKQN